MGRPPGALSGDRRRYTHSQDWELRDPRLMEVDSDEDDTHGVVLDPNAFSARDRRQGGYAGDKLYFDGYDLGQDRWNRRGVYDDGAYDDYISEEDDEGYLQNRKAYQAGGWDKDESLRQTALDRIARARAQGKTNVNLTPEEMAALERRRNQQPEPSTALVSPPATPAKSKVKPSSRSSSSTSLKAQQKPRKSSTSSFFGSPAKSNSKAKVRRSPERKNSTEQALPYPPGTTVLIQGPDGRPMYAPLYSGPPSPELSKSRPGTSGSRSSSKHSRRESTPPEQMPPLPRYYDTRSGSNRSLPEDAEWYPPPARTRSASSAQQFGYDYDMAPPMPAAQGRRNVSGPAAPGHGDVRYASLRRTPQSSSPLAQSRSSASHGRGLRRVETSSSDSSDGQGVLVDIVPDEHGGFSIRQSSPGTPSTPAATATATTTPTKSGNEARKRRSGRR
ncbi:hypothetical protein HII31_10326 [Pseudocercospora fuligena]|uniref:Uncharacterized protein n=1 Tax=Pseudocercospora fuligena TaxID=685502 RepID=A0A8H6VF60_9PEZI|nr:hypothetical protein HII31_10326 [Pseudocercospora fuligena]